MLKSVEKKRDTLINAAYIVLILAAAYLFIKYCFWLVAPFMLTFFFAMLLQSPLRWLDKKTKGKGHAAWSILLVFLSICVVLVPIILILVRLSKEVMGFISYLIDQLNDMPTFLATLENGLLKMLNFLPDGIYTSVSTSITEFFGTLIEDFNISKLGISMGTVTSGLTSGINGMFNIIKSVPSAILGIVIGIIAWIFFTKDYKQIVHFIRIQLPDNKKSLLSEIKQVFSKTILKMLRAYGLIMLITFGELFLGLTILSAIGVMNSSYIVVIAIATAVFDILPVAGSGGVLIPWALISLISGNGGLALGLIIIYGIITLIRQYIEPKIVGDSLGVHPLVTLMGLYFGLKLFGFLGMFIVPITVMTVKAFNDTGRIHLYNVPDRK